MKFVSEKAINGKRLECSTPLDVEFIKKLEPDCDGMLTFEYALRDFQSQFPVSVSRAVIVLKITRDNLFAWATVHIDGDNEDIRQFLDAYGTDYGDLSCDVELTEAESKKLLLHIILHQIT
ncbi:MAG: hypothetical protein FWH03_05570 [Firmicutes bacterium]|nr:hypothetical protein [Bacillota bacterium]